MRINNHKLQVPWKEMYNFAIYMAQSTNNHKQEFKETVNFISQFAK